MKEILQGKILQRNIQPSSLSNWQSEAMVKPGTQKELVEHVLTVIGFDEQARDYLATTKKIYLYVHLVSQTEELIEKYIQKSEAFLLRRMEWRLKS